MIKTPIFSFHPANLQRLWSLSACQQSNPLDVEPWLLPPSPSDEKRCAYRM